MYNVYEVDYHERSWKKGSAKTLEEAKKIASKAFKESNGEFPVFIEDGKGVVFNLA